MSPRSLAVLMPGPTFSARWVAEWSGLLLHLASQFHVRLAWAQGNNIYLTRENVLKLAMGDPNSPPDLLLWLDSDNPPTVSNFEHLIGALDASPDVAIVGGWYRFFNPDTREVYMACGTGNKNVTEEEMLAADHLLEVGFIGFGMCLMRRQVIDDIGLEKCFEPVIWPGNNGHKRGWATDDLGFCERARRAGHRIFVHPAVYVAHEKTMNVPASFDSREIPLLKEQ